MDRVVPLLTEVLRDPALTYHGTLAGAGAEQGGAAGPPMPPPCSWILQGGGPSSVPAAQPANFPF